MSVEATYVPGSDDEYGRRSAAARAFERGLERLLADVLEEAGIRAHSISARVKSRESSSRKVLGLPEMERSLENIGDLLGVRVITYFPDEVKDVARIVEQEFRYDKERSVDKSTLLDPDRFGYLSVHYLAQLNDTRCGLLEYRRHAGQKFEIQIRSILQHAWAEIEHDLGYKSRSAIPAEVRRRFSRLAGLLETADDEFVAIRDSLAKYSESVHDSIRAAPSTVRIDQDSLFEFALSDSHVVEADRMIADLLDVETLTDPQTSDYYGWLSAGFEAFGFSTILDVKTALELHLDEVHRFADKWIQDRTHSKTTTRGISLYYLLLWSGAQLSEAQPLYDWLAQRGFSEPRELADRVRATLWIDRGLT